MNLLFYSADNYFLNEFADYISRTQRDIHLTTYADCSMALDYLHQKWRQIDMILADADFFDNMDNIDKLKVVCSNKTRLNQTGACFSLNIYQAAEDIIRDLKKICLKPGNDDLVIDLQKNSCQMLGFFSIQGGSGQSTIAYQLAAHLAQHQKVLFLSFDFANIYQKLYSVDYPVDLARLMFQIKDRQSSAAEFYKAIVRNQHGVYVLPPFQTIGDIVELTLADVEFLLEQIKCLGEFNRIILDLNHNVDELNQFLLQQCDRIVGVYSADKIGELKMAQFRTDPFVEHWQLTNKIQFVSSKAQTEDVNGLLTFPWASVTGTNDVFGVFFSNSGFKNSCMVLANQI